MFYMGKISFRSNLATILKLILLSISFFLSSSLVLQVSQTHLVNKGEYSFFRESISTFQPIVLRQVIS